MSDIDNFTKFIGSEVGNSYLSEPTRYYSFTILTYSVYKWGLGMHGIKSILLGYFWKASQILINIDSTRILSKFKNKNTTYHCTRSGAVSATKK